MSKNLTNIILHTKNNLLNIDERSQHTFNKYYSSCFKENSEMWLYKNELNYTEIYDILSKSKKKLSILDVGSGCGSESLSFASFGHDVHGIDIKADRVKTAIERSKLFNFKSPTFEVKSIFNITDKYDIIWMNQAFHHIEPREQLCEHLRSLLNKDGKIVIAESNGSNILIQAQLFKVRGFNTITYFEDELGNKLPYGNERVISCMGLKRIMRRYDFRSLTNRFYRVFPNKEKFFKIEKKFEKNKFPSFIYSHMVNSFEKID